MNISFEDFEKVEMKVGKIISVEEVEGSEKLLRLEVDFGEENPRQVISGIKKYFEDIQDLVGVLRVFVTNLEPREIMGLESQAMIMGLGKSVEDFGLLTPTRDVAPGVLIN
jgi:methionyl-tRNA synthetase